MWFRLLPFALLPCFSLAHAANPAIQHSLPSNTPLWIRTDHSIPLKVGQPVHGVLVYPTYADNRVVLPAGIMVLGTITALIPDKPHRIQARLRADFTPFSRPVVRFQQLVLADGTHLQLPAGPATDGAPILKLTPPPYRKGGFIRHQFDDAVEMAKTRIKVVTGPGKQERLKNLLYSQLPYHPQSVASGTVWTVDTTSAVEIPAADIPKPEPPADVLSPAKLTRTANQSAWLLHAYLTDTLSSANAHLGEPIQAVVAQPVLDSSGTVAVPQGSVLEGEITSAKPARRFGRAGELRFDFRRLRIPGDAQDQQVQTSLAGVDASAGANLALDSEGKVKPKPQDKLIVPFILLTLAGRPLDRDRGDSAFGKDAVASNSLGVIGFIIGTAGGWRNLAAGFGYYGSALAIWNRWVKRGEETTLRHDTRILVQANPRHATPLESPNSGPHREPVGAAHR